MKEKIITAIIPDTHRNIVFFLLFIFLLGFFTFIALLEGIKIDHLKLSGVIVEKLYLKWDRALHIKAEKIDLSGLKSDNTPLTLKPLSKLPPLVRRMEAWVATININIIKYHDFTASLSYSKNRPGIIALHYRDSSAKGTFVLNDRSFRLSIPQFTINGGVVSAKMRMKLKEETLTSDITLSLPKTPLISVKLIGDTNSMGFSAHADAPFTTIKPLVDFFDLDPDISPWIIDYAKIGSVRLNRLNGHFAYDTPDDILRTLKADGSVTNGEYTFAQGIDPILSSEINLKFLDGKLSIYPKNGTFYGLPTENSHLYIDFLTPHTMLEAFIKTRNGVLNDSILNLLKHYGINVPVKQTNGTCNVDLNLSINLHSLDTQARGSFTPSESELVLENIPLHTQGGVVNIDGSNVRFEGFKARYGNSIAEAFVKGEFNAANKKGKVNIDAFRFSFLADPSQFSLYDMNNPLHVVYTIEPQGDSLHVNPSAWNLFGKKLSLGAFTAPFDYHNARATIQNASFTVDDTIRGTFRGDFNGIDKVTDMNITLNQMDAQEVLLTQSPLQINLHYAGNSLKLTSPSASAWSIHRLPVLFSPFSASIQDHTLTFGRIETVVDDVVKGDISGTYDVSADQGKIRLGNILPLKPKITPYIQTNESIDMQVDGSNENLVLTVPAYKTYFTTVPKGWKISLADIYLLARKSPLLRRYKIDNGHLDILYTGERSLYNFSGEINYPYSLILINDEPINRYRFSGTYQDGRSTTRVNNRVMIDNFENDTRIKAMNVGINLPELFRFLSSQSSENTDNHAEKEAQSVTILATHTYLYLMEGRRIIADSLNASLYDENFDASLEHMGGHARLKIRHGLFSIIGNEFNDRFMDHLFALSDFSDGKFSFEAKGDSDAFDGIMRVENTVLKDYKVLNNVLAFINTIPSLATFSLPNYHTQGLPVSEGYAHFAYNRGKVKVDNFTLNSHEIKLMGETQADMKNKTIDGTITLKTDLGSKLSKVPMVGYILFGDDGSVSTTVTISGNLEDPKVETAIAKEIVTAPFNILKRTLVYPFLWMIDDEKKK